MLPLILKNWRLCIAGIVILVAVAYVGVLRLQLAVLNRTVSQQTQEIAELKASTALQNQAVQNLKLAAEAAEKRTLAAQKKAQELSRAATASATQILSQSVESSCEGSLNWLRDQGKELGW